MAAKKKTPAKKKKPAVKKKPAPRKSPKAKKAAGKRRVANREQQSDVHVPYATVRDSTGVGVGNSVDTAASGSTGGFAAAEEIANYLEKIRSVRLLSHLPGGSHTSNPLPASAANPSARTASVAEAVGDREKKLGVMAPHLAGDDVHTLMRKAVWLGDGVRLPRPAIVGRALHELGSFSEADAPGRGTAGHICARIKLRAPDQLRKPIQKAMASGKDAEHISATLIGFLNKAWAVLERLDLLQAARVSGVYLLELGRKVFDDFPDWKTPDEATAKKPQRPPRKPGP